MTKYTKAERRLHPRIQQKLPVKIAANGYDFATTTQNISCVGAYCHVEKYIPPFTRVMVKVALPTAANPKNSHPCIECRGVIVRAEDAATGGFNIAVFFNEIKDTERKKISQYISHFLAQ
jgi:hypothetical protein